MVRIAMAIEGEIVDAKSIRDADTGKCDAPNLGCSLTTHQPAEILYVSYRETHT